MIVLLCISDARILRLANPSHCPVGHRLNRNGKCVPIPVIGSSSSLPTRTENEDVNWDYTDLILKPARCAPCEALDKRGKCNPIWNCQP
ncbi:hypothetical protein PVAND_012355 [Polypedilum vanderplanki]|uniref:Uncharacterized protein n=1 Tax=Polypedilum vanderplanki TaxID=319348 RepID=A0A9J6CM69_POLVA|nr:hypothetical protein PVAND_012355 [Polypedilum vanderplanki]